MYESKLIQTRNIIIRFKIQNNYQNTVKFSVFSVLRDREFIYNGSIFKLNLLEMVMVMVADDGQKRNIYCNYFIVFFIFRFDWKLQNLNLWCVFYFLNFYFILFLFWNLFWEEGVQTRCSILILQINF